MIAVGAVLGGVVGELQVVLIENFGNEPGHQALRIVLHQ
jgi:hypothetical protein